MGVLLTVMDEIKAVHNPGSRNWIEDAACAGINTDLFFHTNNDCDVPLMRRIKQMCDGCPVQLDCLAYGMRETGGIWGGATQVERRLIAGLPGTLDEARKHSRWLREFIDRNGPKINGCLQNLPTACLQGDLAVSKSVSGL